jgi:outer membrane protein
MVTLGLLAAGTMGVGASAVAGIDDTESIPPTCAADGVAGATLSLARGVELALCSNAEIQSAAAAVLVRAAQLGEARSEYWPTLTASTAELHEQTRYPGSSVPTAHDNALTVYGALSWRLFDFGGRAADTRASSKLLEVAMQTHDATIQKVLGGVVEAYFDAVTAKGLLGSKQDTETLARATLASAQRRLQQGNGAQSDELQARTALARASLDANRAAANYTKALAVLTYSVGLRPGASYTVPDDANVPTSDDDRSLEAWLNEARQHHPALNAARADVEAAEAQVEAAKSRGRPTLDLQANYYENGFPEQGLATTRQRDTTVGIAINIPLFDGFLNRYRVKEAEANVRYKEAALLDTERSTLTGIIRAYADAKAAAADLRDSQNLLDTAQAASASSQRRYEVGATDIVELLNTRAALADARQERVRSLAEWRSARLRLLATSGTLTEAATTP